jgi:pyruvate dehydrogenase E2 component (dihydrolipoamide acetyltransferase)/2-oxoglutarate dehydrogenase E2 component (dihydrolipoamide succinyltransferase)
MPHDVTMPQLGMAQDAGKIVSWFKAEGEAVAKGDALFEVETDKAVMEVEAQAAGFLTGITAAEGTDVPVGHVIAQISDSPDASASETPAPAPAPAAPQSDNDTSTPLPEGKQITMPQLGMAQDSGVLIGWHKTPGDAVAADDVLFEVETDKSAMEVNAGFDGYLAATLAEPGDAVPVGDLVAIISAEKPANPVARGASSAREPAQTTTAPVPVAAPNPTPSAKTTAKTTEPHHQAKSATSAPGATKGGRILASPKARRLALERGLDLSRLVQAGHPQPYHVADLDVLAAMPEPAVAVATAAPARHLAAVVQHDGFTDLVEWAAKAHGLEDRDAILAGLAGASLPQTHPAVVAIERHGQSRGYRVPMSGGLSLVIPDDGAPDLIVRDLRGTAIRAVSLGAGVAPVLTLMPSDTGAMTLTLECSAAQLTAEAAIHLLSQFAGRMEQPLRHLL